MLTRRYRIWTGLILVVVGAALAAACDLNPQPLPPGDTANGAADAGAGSAPVATGQGDAGGTNFGAGDQDAGDAGEGGADTGLPGEPIPDGGDAGVEADAGDAAPVDGAADGGEDAL
jgi:hypothetical protein